MTTVIHTLLVAGAILYLVAIGALALALLTAPQED